MTAKNLKLHLPKYGRVKKKFKLFSLDDFFNTTEDFKHSSVPLFNKNDIFKDPVPYYLH